MSIFTTLDYSTSVDPFLFMPTMCQSINPQKILGKCYSHSVYTEISKSSLETIIKLNENNLKNFTIYRKGEDTLLFVRVDGILECENPKYIVYDIYEITSCERYTYGAINYCIDEVKTSEICSKDQINKTLENIDLVAHGQWAYKDTGIMYYGLHIKDNDISSPFIMFTLTSQEIRIFSEEYVQKKLLLNTDDHPH